MPHINSSAPRSSTELIFAWTNAADDDGTTTNKDETEHIDPSSPIRCVLMEYQRKGDTPQQWTPRAFDCLSPNDQRTFILTG